MFHLKSLAWHISESDWKYGQFFRNKTIICTKYSWKKNNLISLSFSLLITFLFYLFIALTACKYVLVIKHQCFHNKGLPDDNCMSDWVGCWTDILPKQHYIQTFIESEIPKFEPYLNGYEDGIILCMISHILQGVTLSPERNTFLRK